VDVSSVHDDGGITEPVHIRVILDRVLADAEAARVLRLIKTVERRRRKRAAW
jgi:hypothetical protein